MAEKIFFIDATDGLPEYDSADYAEVKNAEIADGVAPGYLGELEISKGAGLQVIVDDGAVTFRGRTYIQDEPSDGINPKSLEIDPTTTGLLRKDAVVVEFNIDYGTATAVVIKGTEKAQDPDVPTWTDAEWRVTLGIVNVDGGSIDSVEDARTMGGARVNIDSATETVEGLVRKATTTETRAGTNDTGYVTPAKLKPLLDDKEGTLNADQKRHITVSDISPTPEDGNNGDIWLEY